MGHHPARAMYDHLEDGLLSITRQLRLAIEAREVSADLGSVLLDTLGLAATIEWHVRQFQRCTGILYELTVSDAAGFDLPDDYAATIFDVYNEALSNVARHSGAKRVAVALTIAPHEVTLVVRDDGIGRSSDTPVSSVGGFAAVRARAQACKGVCQVTSARNAGTTVAVSLPIPRDQRP